MFFLQGYIVAGTFFMLQAVKIFLKSRGVTCFLFSRLEHTYCIAKRQKNIASGTWDLNVAIKFEQKCNK